MKLYTWMFPTGEWTEPCDLRCRRCGWTRRVETCERARAEAHAHDATHWAEDESNGTL